MKSPRKTPLKLEDVKAESCTFDSRMKILHDLPFFKKISREEIHNVNNVFSDTKCNIDEVIYREGERSTRLYVIASGSVKLIKQNFDGKEVLIDILKQGEFFGNLDPFGETFYDETAIAQVSSCIMIINSEQFRTILEKYPAASLKVLDIMSKRLREAQEMIKLLSAYSVENRVAYTILKLGEKLGNPNKLGLLIQIPLSRYDIAGMTGTTPETTSRIISKFKEEGLISTGRKWTVIKNINRLKEKVKI
ncbi:MAG: Crp/Fnr family transcriptional regulator [Ignavibacteriae bacterium]|nr:Crp/Fnr family transcriptional regulator [Ignavibacteriota bacterium]